MLKRIEVADLRLGMYIHKLEGPWFRHSFWKTKFLLSDADQLAELRDSGVTVVIIDIEKGDDVGATEPAPPRRRPLVSRQSVADGAPALSTQSPVRRPPPSLAPPPVRASGPFDRRSTQAVHTAREIANVNRVVAEGQRVLAGVFHQARLGKALNRAQVEPIIDELFASIQRNPHAFNGLMRVKRDNASLYMHALAVSAMMIALGRHMNMSEKQIREAGLAGLLMDVGMGHLPLDVSTITHELSEAEYEIVKTHTQLGYDFLELGGEIPEAVARVCLEHHERQDGSGYPLGLTGDAIGLYGRMAAICDVYDSLTSDRPHRPRTDPSDALVRMREMTEQLDQEILGHFIESLGVYPIGSVVRLSSQRLALVVDQNSDDFTRPRVWAFYGIVERRVIRPEDIDLRYAPSREEILCSDDATAHGIANFGELREMVFHSACKALN